MINIYSFYRCGVDEKLTQIAVDKNVQTLDGDIYDILYIGTDKGRVMKVRYR